MAQAGPVRSTPGDSAEVLRAKYLDYCSAQLADLLLYLSADEMYVLAEEAARESPDDAPPSFDRTVRLATEWLSRKIVLPPFEVWVQDYSAHPDLYEEYLMGFWEPEPALS